MFDENNDDALRFKEVNNMLENNLHAAEERKSREANTKHHTEVKKAEVDASKARRRLESFISARSSKIEENDKASAKDIFKQMLKELNQEFEKVDLGAVQGLTDAAENLLKEFKKKY